MIKFNKKLIFKKFFIDNTYFFLSAITTLGLIVWVIQAVNYLDFVTEDGHGLGVYFKYSILSLPKILSRLFPLVFFISVFYTINKFEQNNELKIFWINGINKTKFIKNLIIYSLTSLIFLYILTSYIVPWSQNKSRVYLQESNIDYFPSLISEKKFIDTVDKLTIYIEKKVETETYENIFIKDTDKEKTKFIYANTGKLINKPDERIFKLFNGKIINVNSGKITSFDFKTTNFDLSKYLTKSTTDFKIQEKKTSSLLNCYINYFLLDKDYFYDVLNCNDPAIKEMQKELFTRLIKPLFLPVISLSLCFLLLYPKENSNYKFSRVWIFSLGFLIIIFSEITSPLTVRNFLYFKLSLVIPFVIFIIQYIFLFNIINRYKKL
jgi:lipopolysaccharide export system permease protein